MAWNIESDIINEPADCDPAAVALLQVNAFPASSVFYALVNARQREGLAQLRHSCTLVIPAGVAHRFEGLGGIFTLNQGEALLDEDGNYDAANDVIDWPIERDDYPVLRPNETAADRRYYEHFRARQEHSLAMPDSGAQSTPVILLARDERGEDVRVAVRRVQD